MVTVVHLWLFASKAWRSSPLPLNFSARKQLKMRLALLLFCCGALASISRPSGAAAAAADLGTAANPIKVCVQETRPYVFVDNSTGAVYGYEPDLFNSLAKSLGLAFETRVIKEFPDLITGLLLPAADPQRCDLGMSGMSTANVPISAGVKCSTTIFRNGMSVITNVAVVRATDLWTFGRIFNKDLWIALVISAFGLACLVYVVERDFKQKGLGKIAYPVEVRPGLVESFFQSFSKLVNNSNGIPASSIAAKLMSLGWGLVILVCISSYTAGLTASMSVAAFESHLSSYKDLNNATNPNLKIGTWDYYREAGLFDRYGFLPVGLPWNSQPDVNAMIDKLAAGQLDAVVLDTGILRYNIGPRCDVQTVGPVFLYSEIVYAMHASITPEFMDTFNNGLVKLQELSVNEDLESVYMPQQVCNPYNEISTAVSFGMVKGVFIILGALTGLGLLLAVLPRISKRFETDSRVTPGELRGASMSTRIKSVFAKLSFRGESVKVEPETRPVQAQDLPQPPRPDLTVNVQREAEEKQQWKGPSHASEPVPKADDDDDMPAPSARANSKPQPEQQDVQAVEQAMDELFHRTSHLPDAKPPTAAQAPAHIEVVDL